MQDVTRTNRVWTVPNILSMVRLAGVPQMRDRRELLGCVPRLVTVERRVLGVHGAGSAERLVLRVALPLPGDVLDRPVQPHSGVVSAGGKPGIIAVNTVAVQGFGGVFPVVSFRLATREVETLLARRPSRGISGPPCRISVLRCCARYWVLSHWTSFHPRLY